MKGKSIFVFFVLSISMAFGLLLVGPTLHSANKAFAGDSIQSGPRLTTAAPFEGELISEEELKPTLSMAALMVSLSLSGDVLKDGADRLTALQRFDGGWAWPLQDPSTNASPVNTVGPIAKGLAEAYLYTKDTSHLDALNNAGGLLLSKRYNFSPSDGYLAATLDNILGGTIYTDHVKNYFYGPLASGTYNRNGAGTLYDTTSYVNLIRTSRANQGIPNLAAWDIGMGLAAAAAVGADTSAWIVGVKAEINELDANKYYDVIGLAGAIYGLAYVGEDFDPSEGAHAAANNLADLGQILAGYQLDTGGFTWNSNYMGEGEYNETIQETAYSILALDKLNQTVYQGAIQRAVNYLKSVQLGTGGWENHVGGGENNEVTGEALWGICTAKYTLTYTAGPNGTISGTSPQTVNYGASGSPVTAVPNVGYHFVNWSDGSTANPRTDTNVTADISVTANFAFYPFANFIIEEAKIHWKKKPDDDKIMVKGSFSLLPNSDGVNPGDLVTVVVGKFLQAITMDVKDNGKKWEFKRDKGDTGIKDMKLEFKKNEIKFEIHVDKAELPDMLFWGNPNALLISLQIGDDKGTATISMKVHKDKWEYRK